MSLFTPSPLTRRRWANFRANKRAYWSLWLFLILFGLSLIAELIANDKPILVKYDGGYYMPVFKSYAETDFGGEFATEADYHAPEVQCLIAYGGNQDCLYGDIAEGTETTGWTIWPPIRFSFNSIDYTPGVALTPPSKDHWFGTDNQARDIAARVIYGFRISVLFALTVTLVSSLIGIFAGAVQGFFGGRIDLIMQRLIEIWASLPILYTIIIVSRLFTMSFTLMATIIILFSWTTLVGVVRAEFLRARNFEYVRAARALGVSNGKIMRRHLLPNAMVATITFMPFIVTGAVSLLATLDFLGFGLPAGYPSLGELALQANNNLSAVWIAWAAFLSFTVMLALLVFIFEGVRDAFDPRKVFA